MSTYELYFNKQSSIHRGTSSLITFTSRIVFENHIALKKYNLYIIYYAYGIIKVKYLEILVTISFDRLLFIFSYNDYNYKMYLILYYLF